VSRRRSASASERVQAPAALSCHKEVIMLIARIRFGLLVATLAASLHVAAEPRVWTLTDVQVNRFNFYAFDDPPRDPVTGWLVYDDATLTISNWSVRFPQPFFDFPSFTYVPGNSLMYVTRSGPLDLPFLIFSAAMGEAGPDFAVRQLQLVPLGALDGSNAVVALDTSESRVDYFLLGPTQRRTIAGGSLTLTASAPPVAIVQVDEFYHAGLRHYYMTADDAEKRALDSGAHAGWQRTGESFKAYAAGSRPGGSVNPVCRFYSPPLVESDVGLDPGADSHFFSADAGECMAVFRKWWWFWGFPQDNVFQIDVPDKTTGACPAGTIPVTRLWNQRFDSNHRHTKSAAVKGQMIAEGYLDEGVRMCALQ
jgi:hypothetical protein